MRTFNSTPTAAHTSPGGRFALHFVILLTETTPAAFAERAATGMDVGVALTDGRLTATLTGTDWPGAEPVTPSRTTPQP
jgi:hypothetical protein